MALPKLLNPFTVPCVSCGAVAGEQCRNDAAEGRPYLRRAIAHPARIRAAYADVIDDDQEA